jgi:hypothetical protein
MFICFFFVFYGHLFEQHFQAIVIVPFLCVCGTDRKRKDNYFILLDFEEDLRRKFNYF